MAEGSDKNLKGYGITSITLQIYFIVTVSIYFLAFEFHYS